MTASEWLQLISWGAGLWIFLTHLVMQPIFKMFAKKDITFNKNLGNFLFYS